MPGSYDYPVWFDGDQAFYHLSKKVPPKGESLIYFLEGQGTPTSISTPAGILKETLGRLASDPILDVTGRKLRTHHRRGGEVSTAPAPAAAPKPSRRSLKQAKRSAGRMTSKGTCKTWSILCTIMWTESMSTADSPMNWANFFRRTKPSSPDLGAFVDDLQQILQQIPAGIQRPAGKHEIIRCTQMIWFAA